MKSMAEMTEAEKAKAKWCEEYKKNEASTMFDNFAYLNARLADMDAKIDQLNPQTTLQRQVMLLSSVIADMNRRIVELEKTSKKA